MHLFRSTLVLSLCTALAAQVVEDRKSLSLEGARKVTAAIEQEARRQGATAVIAVVDAGGNLMQLTRLDGTFAAGATVATGKARTAVLFQKPTKFFEDLINKGRTAMTTVDFTPLQGGVPIVVDGQVVGAVGVSGAKSAAQDEEFAQLGAGALATPTPAASGSAPLAPVTWFDRATVDAAFQKGAVLLDAGSFMVHASRRERPGQAEVHRTETDVIYVLDGTATVVTGGTVLDGQQVAANEVRGRAIDGGQARTLQKGDVLVVPRGTPHWFQEVAAPFTYYVVKVVADAGGCR